MTEHKGNTTLPWTGERYLPEISGSIAIEHIHRYALASQFAKNKKVLDIASGEGYGSKILAKYAHSVVGVDISIDAVLHAKNNYACGNLSFIAGTCAEIPLKSASVDLIVSFETIEHHDQHEAMLNEFSRILHSGGLLIISSPDKHVYSDVPGYRNPFHVKELYRNEFVKLVSAHFKHVQVYGQRMLTGSGIFPERGEGWCLNFARDKSKTDFRTTTPQAVYHIIAATNGELPPAICGLFEQPDSENETIQNLILAKNAALKEVGISVSKAIAFSEQVDSLQNEKEKLNAILAEKERQIEQHDSTLAEKERQIEQHDSTIFAAHTELKAVYNSFSWRLTRPLRKFKQIYINLRKLIKSVNKNFNVLKNLSKKIIKASAVLDCKNGRTAAKVLEENQNGPQKKDEHLDPSKEIPKIDASQFDMGIHEGINKISIVIPTKNGGSLFRGVAKAIRAQIIDIPYEFIVIDSGSNDNTVDIAKNAGAAVIEIDPDDFNHGKTRNAAIMQCTGDIVVLMTQDALPANPHLLSALIKPFENRSIAGVYARQSPLPDADPITKRNLLNWVTALTYPVISKISDREEYNRLPPFEKYLICNFDNVCSAVRKSVWEKVPFSQEYFGEDIAWAKRILELGWSIAYEPAAHVLHSHNRSVAYEFKRTYLCHRKLFELFGLRTVPDMKTALWSICAQSILDWKYLISERLSIVQKAKLICKALPMSVASVSGQYLGANDAYKGISKSFKGV